MHYFCCGGAGIDIKYCATQADKEACKSEMPKMEFDTINEIADDCHAAHLIQPFYLITPKNQAMVRYRQALKDRDDIERYRVIYPENKNSVMLKGMRKHEDLTFDYYVHINRQMETEFSAPAFQENCAGSETKLCEDNIQHSYLYRKGNV